MHPCLLYTSYPERTVTLVDTKSISRGAALLVYKALQMREAGSSIEEITLWLENNKICLLYTSRCV